MPAGGWIRLVEERGKVSEVTQRQDATLELDGFDPEDYLEFLKRSQERAVEGNAKPGVKLFSAVLREACTRILTPHQTEDERMDRAMSLQWLCEPGIEEYGGRMVCDMLSRAGVIKISPGYPTDWKALTDGIKMALENGMLLEEQSSEPLSHECLRCGRRFLLKRRVTAHDPQSYCSVLCRNAAVAVLGGRALKPTRLDRQKKHAILLV